MCTTTHVVLSYPEDLSDWGRWQLDEHAFQSYLRRVHDTVAVGDVWDVFLDVGCCGDSMDLGLRVETIEGGPELDENTEFEFVTREECMAQRGWEVQSAAGPE